MTHPAFLRRLAAAAAVVLLAGCASTPAATRPTSAVRPATLGTAAVAFLDTLERRTFDWFWETTNAANGMTPDRWPSRPFASIAAVGFALTAYPVGVERGWITREQAAERTLTTLRAFWTLPQGEAASGTIGQWGFFYHFLDMQTGLRH